MIKKFIILILLLSSTNLISAQNEIEISRCSVSEISSKDFLLSYSIKNTFDIESYSHHQVIIPFEKLIIQGSVEEGILNEKDFLFSHINIDINGDSDILDSLKVRIADNKLIVGNRIISPLFKATSKFQTHLPFDASGNYNLNKVSEKGKTFTLRSITSAPPEIILGLNSSDDIEFMKYSNSLLFVEVITSDKNAVEKLFIGGQKTFSGETNEKILTGGENLYRVAAAKNINVEKNTSGGTIKIGNIMKPFVLRITYYFAIDENLTIMNQKIIEVN